MSDDETLEQEAQQARTRVKGWHNVVGATTEELRRAEIEALFLYGDIIDMPAHVSQTHPRQPRTTRAAQFAPFAALVGYDDVIEETAREVDQMPDLDEDERAQLDAMLSVIDSCIDEQPHIELVYFEPDHLKEGGRLTQVTGVVEKINHDRRILVLEGGRAIPIDSIVEVGLQ